MGVKGEQANGVTRAVRPRDTARLRIAYVYRDFHRDGSIPTVFATRSERLARDEEVVAFCSARTRAATSAPLEFHTVEPLVRGRGRIGYALETGSFALAARRAIRRLRHRFDVVHVVGFAAPEADLVTVHAVRPAEIDHYFAHVEPGARLRHRLTPLLRPQSLAVMAIEQKLFRPPYPYCITPSEAVAADLVRHYGVPRDAIESIPVGVDVHHFAHRPHARVAMRRRLGTPDDRLVVLFVGDDFERKGLDRAIAALGRLRAAAELWVAGAGPRDRYEALARSVGPNHVVRFLGRVPREELPSAYAAADVFLLPSRQDSWGHPVLEALAAGCVVLVSQFAGAHEAIHDGVDGFVLQGEGAPEQIAALLERLASAREARSAIGQRAVATAAAYDQDLLYERLRSAHRKAHERRVGRRHASLTQ